MNQVREIVRDAAIGVAVTDTQDGLDSLRKPGCAAVIWRKQPTAAVQNWIDALPADLLPTVRVILRPDEVREAVNWICDDRGMPASAEREALIGDICALARRFADLMQAPHLRLRLEAVTSNACRKFHIDGITARLICTYRGTGTQYGISTDGEDPRRVFTVPTGAAVVLRGTRWPEEPSSGLLHRSPPIEGTGETRLVLVLDPIYDPEEEG